MKNVMKLIFAVLLCETAGLIGSLFTRMSLSPWYDGLAKPFFTPPGWVFAPAWTFLYAAMGAAAFLVWNSGLEKPVVKKSLVLFVIHLCVNITWSAVFFGLQSPLGGAIVILVLWGMILALMILFWRISRMAGWLLVPYLAWVTFASALNIGIALLN